MPNDRVSSIRVKPGFRAEIFADTNYGGRSLILTGDDGCLDNDNFNDVLSSIRITRVDGGAAVDQTRWYQIVNRNSGRCLDVTNFGRTNGTPLQQWDCSSPRASNQEWQFRPVGDGYYQVVSRFEPTLFWDVNGGPSATGNGAAVNLWGYVGGSNQQWRPVALSGGDYEFRARHSNRCLDVRDVSTANGARLQQYDCTGGPAQRFRLN